mmetsp:Transcript_103136/g.300795  ORF Transcript_103136/g.300795 Transcript_103136/m.300795 type:complete len:530 (-) Transcript_103136:166-1755(-)
MVRVTRAQEQASAPRIRKLSALPVVPPGEVGLDAKALEDHRQRSGWQLSLGLLPGLAECVVAKDQIAYLDLQGRADLEQGTPVRPKTLFRCFSMTKPITAVAAMRLVELGKISLDDPVGKYIPSFSNMKVVRPEAVEQWGVSLETPEHLEELRSPITLRHLLTHTSGLAYGPDRSELSEELKPKDPVEESYRPLVEAVDGGEIDTLAQFCDALAALPLRFQPGSEFLYSHGVDVVGRVIEVVSGMPLDAFLWKSVLRPVGMSHTTFSIPHKRVGDLAAMYKAECEEPKASASAGPRSPHQKPAEPEQQPISVRLVRVDGQRPEDSAWYGHVGVLAGGGMMGSCAGGLVSCLRDVALFCNMLMNGGKTLSGRRVLRRSTVSSLWRDWLRLRSVTGDRAGQPLTLKGWTNGWRIGWSPLGHVRRHDKCLYMGGWSTSWAIYPRWKLATVSLTQSMIWFDVPAWDSKRDELDRVVETVQKRMRQRARQARGAAGAAAGAGPGKRKRAAGRRSSSSDVPAKARRSSKSPEGSQ